jgi:hypothetical protein
MKFMADQLQPAQAGTPGGLSGSARQALAYGAVVALLPLATWFLPPVLVLRSGADHALLDLATALTACFCSLQAFVRYQSRPQPMFLWLGAGFLASGMLDGLHAMASLGGAGDPDNFGTRTWSASTLLLGAYLIAGLARHREPHTRRGTRSQETRVWGITLAALGVLLPMIWLMPPMKVVFDGPCTGRSSWSPRPSWRWRSSTPGAAGRRATTRRSSAAWRWRCCCTPCSTPG